MKQQKTKIRIYKTKQGNYATIDGVNVPFNQALKAVKEGSFKQLEKHENEHQVVYIYEQIIPQPDLSFIDKELRKNK